MLLVVLVVVLCSCKLARLDHPAAGRAGFAYRHCAAMAAMGFSLNNLSLFGLVLAIGIVVDDAIVVVENVERNIALGLSAARRHGQGDG